MMFTFFLAATVLADVVQWRQKLLNGSNHNKYCTYKEYNDILEEMIKKYPKLLRKEKVGESFLKNPMYVYHFVDQDSTLPQEDVFINSLFHAREAQTVLTLVNFVLRSLEAFDKGEPETLYAIKRRHIVLLPFVNPDSYIANEDSREHFIRKNQRDVCTILGERQKGVDLNRNFPVGWTEGQPNPCSETYRGEKPFSEPETQAVKSVVEEHKFRVSYSIHGYGQMLIIPGNSTRKVQEKDRQVFDELQEVIQAKKYGNPMQTVNYEAGGGDTDWMYEVHNIIAVVPEVGTAFWMKPGEKDRFLKKEWPRMKYVVYKAGCEPRVDAAQGASEFMVANDGMSDCPELKLAFSTNGGDPVVIDVGTVPSRGSKKMAGNTGNVNDVCVKEKGLDVCRCNPAGPGKGAWVNSGNALCAALITGDSATAPRPSGTPSSNPTTSPSPSASGRASFWDGNLLFIVVAASACLKLAVIFFLCVRKKTSTPDSRPGNRLPY